MADTRTRDQTRAGVAPMQGQGMPAGQAPATQRPMTAVQRRDAENAKKSTAVRMDLLAAVEHERLNIDSFLGVFGISYDLFLAGLMVFLSKQQRDTPDFFVDLDVASFIEALTRVAMNGLIPDGKEAAIAAYKDRDLGNIRVAQPMFMRDGFVKVLWRTGMVLAINDQVVTVKEYDAGRFEYEEGDQGFIRHKLDLLRKDTDPVIAAYCIIKLSGGEDMREVVPRDELEKMAAMSRSPARKAWQHQMHRKGAIRRIMGKMPREKGIVQLLQHDDETYLKTPAAGGGAPDGAPTHEELFSSKPIRRKKREPLKVEDGRITEDLDVYAGDQVLATVDGDGKILDAEIERGQDFILRAIITTKNGVQQYEANDMGSELWFGDLQQKMKHLEGEKLGAFWKVNRDHINEAGRNGFADYAMRLVALADELGLIEKGGDQ